MGGDLGEVWPFSFLHVLDLVINQLVFFCQLEQVLVLTDQGILTLWPAASKGSSCGM